MQVMLLSKTQDSFSRVSEEDLQKNKHIMKMEEINKEKMEAVEILYCPPDVVDAHGDYMTREDIEYMVKNFNDNIRDIPINISHAVNLPPSIVYPVKAWVNETDCYIGDTFIPEGTPLVKIKFEDPELWEMRKNGTLMGVSIGAMGERYND